MIPKIIHYCWFGHSPLPKEAVQCIESWKKFLPEYEIQVWNEDNFDVNICPYVQQAYAAKKYAFVSDYARFYILYKYGGVYFDTDVEVIKPLAKILANGPFMAIEKSYATENTGSKFDIGVNPGLGLAAMPGADLLKHLLDIYNNLDFNPERDGTIVSITTRLLFEEGLQNRNEMQKVKGFTIYPAEFFCPMDHTTGIITLTDKTVTIHHYTASWVDHTTLRYKLHQLKNWCYRIFGETVVNKLVSLIK